MEKKYFAEFYSELNKYVTGVHVLKEGATNYEIDNFEKEYHIILPKRFKEWLILNNGGELFANPVGTKLVGILGNHERKKGIFYLEDNFDSQKRVGIPNYVFVVATTCDGNVIGFDFNHTNKSDGTMVRWCHETNEIEKVWNKFSDWLIYEMKIGKLITNYDGSDADDFF